MSQIVLQKYINDYWIVHLDDIIIYSKDWESHLRHISLVIEADIHELTCTSNQCFFARQEIECMGHRNIPDNNQAQDSHIRAILNSDPPTLHLSSVTSE